MSFIFSKSLSAALLVCGIAACTSAAAQPPLMIVVGALADYKSFRLTSTQLDAVVAPYCTKVRDKARKSTILKEYTCAPTSGITAVRVDSREGLGDPLPNYMMSVVVDFPADDFSAVKTLIEKKIGRAHKTGVDYAAWPYASDKVLNQNGNPVINLSRSTAEKTSSFQLALEQGP